MKAEFHLIQASTPGVQLGQVFLLLLVRQNLSKDRDDGDKVARCEQDLSKDRDDGDKVV